MKSSTPQGTTYDDAKRDDGRNAAATSTARPSPGGRGDSSSRPQLVRSPAGRSSDISHSLTESSEPTESEDASTSASDDGEVERQPASDKARKGKPTASQSSAEEERLAKMKDAMHAKLLQQQRMRRSQGSLRGVNGSARVSPIEEEASAAADAPSLSAVASNPPPPARTASALSSESTESTESSKTVRASKPQTPAGNPPPRTPSYPFPYVPGTPKAWPSNFHQPFTSLSPTVSGHPGNEDDTPGKTSEMFSGGSTPALDSSAFLPPGATPRISEDPRFPTPNLYDLVLQLTSEPGMEQWWSTVTNVMHDHYKADRVTLVMPMDPTDIENVPWGQKATFSMSGIEEFYSHPAILQQTALARVPSTQSRRPDFPIRQSSTEVRKSPLDKTRPRLEARHSYAGHGRERLEDSSSKPRRPQGPQRTATHAAGITSHPPRMPPNRFPSSSSMRHGSLSDPAFSSVAGDVQIGPYAEVFPTLRGLDHEARPLIESSGVNRVLDRGRVVTVTRDYVPETTTTGDQQQSKSGTDSSDPTPTPGSWTQFANMRREVFGAGNFPSLSRDYEEYEQYPSSPWSQSPAPSPAIQADEEANPFFASGVQNVEDSFDPATTPKDYTQFGQVEAIGVEHASTVIHIPLVHPLLSQPMQSLKTYAEHVNRPGPPKRSNTLDMERKAPIAILSILASTVPYPQSLTQSLKLLGPHLATSFAISQQFSSTHPQAVTIRHRRTASGRSVTNAPMTIEPASLADIVNAEVERPAGSLSGSVTSPSEYSSKSRYSPTSSIVGTPGWDPASHFWNSSKTGPNTPGMTGSEMVDNYFESKKRSGQRSGSNASNQVTQTTPARAVRKNPSSESRSSNRKPSPSPEEETKSSFEKRSKGSISTRDEHPSGHPAARAHSPLRQSDQSRSQRPLPIRAASHAGELATDKRHSQLHSYGADFNASFGELAAASADVATPAGLGHARKSSQSEDMPPPSERLLRTIIDSVPVQIFTAEPETGKMTWVNQKFMIYRGQEARQVLTDPWQAIHPDDRSEFTASWHRSLRTAQQLQQKVRLERFDGSYRWFYVRAAPLKDKRQKIVHWIGTMMDFHEQHMAEMNLARQHETAASEAKYRALANSSPQIVFAVSKTKGVTFCNSQWLHFSGQTEAQALGVGFMDHVHPDDLAKCKLPTFDDGTEEATNVPQSVPPELVRNNTTSATSSSGSSETEKGVSSTEGSPVTSQMPQRKLSELAGTGILKVSWDADGRPSYSTEVRLKSRDGKFRWHLVRILLAEPLLQNEYEEETWYGTCTDINDHKMLERDLKETMDEKSRFLSNMSHEIRTPLNGITGMVNFLIDSSLTTEQLEHVNIIRSSTEGLRGLINDILDLSKAEAGMIQLNMDWMYVRALIEEVNDLTSTMAIDKGLELNYIVEEDVPVQVKGDRFRMRQILLNIVGNAIKFTSKGEVFVRCTTQKSAQSELAKNETYIKFDVVDSGRGFTEKDAEHLFKRFSQIDGSSTRQHGGTGLGLVISRQLAQLHGGDMSATGVPDKGSTFTFFVKATLPSPRDQPPPPKPPGIVTIPMLPGPMPSPSVAPKPQLTKTPSIPMSMEGLAKASPKFALEHTQTPSPYATSPDVGRESPSASSASSDPSLKSMARTSSLRSERSSASSYAPDAIPPPPPIKLALPTDAKRSGSETESPKTRSSLSFAKTPSPGEGIFPPMYSILVLCPLKYSREATVEHIDKTLPRNIPHQISARESLSECQEMIGGEDPVIFTHIVVVLQSVDEIVALVQQILGSTPHQGTEIVIITDLAQRRSIMQKAPSVYNYDELARQRRLRFVFKPLKPSRFAAIFDPQKEREMSTDRNHDSAQQVALTQKQVFENLTSRLGNKGKRVLLVEDNRTNQLVSAHYTVNLRECKANPLIGCPEVLEEGIHRHRNDDRRRRMYRQSVCQPSRLLFDHTLRFAHAKQGRLPNVQGDSQVGAA
jgi:PAS domain S-box-containing protein